MDYPTKIEIEGLKTIHKLCKFGADRNMEGCSFTEIVERMFDELQAAKASAAEGFVLVLKEPTKEQYGGFARLLGRYMQAHSRYCPSNLKKVH